MTRVQADIVPPIKDWLAARLTGVTVRLSVAAEWTPAAGPVLVVADDGGPMQWPIYAKHTIRLTVHAAGRTEARRIAALAAGLLAESSPRPTGVGGVGDIGCILEARDPATGAFLASVLIDAHARTVEV